MTLIVIVDDYSAFISKASLSQEDWGDNRIVAQFKTRGMSVTLVLTYCGHLQHLLAKQA